MNILKSLLLFFIPAFAFSQSKMLDCKCPLPYSGIKAERIFQLTNSKAIALCGYTDTETVKGKMLYTGFTLSACGTNKAINFWGEVLTCDVTTSNDTLIVKTIENLPVGKNMHYLETVWRIEHIWFRNNELFRDSIINPQLPKYTKAQIADVLNLYDHTPNLNKDKTNELADKLLISTFSGSKIAEYYLTNFCKKFTRLDGVNLEEYDTIMGMLNLWKVTH